MTESEENMTYETNIYRTPPDPTGREEKEMAVYSLMETLEISYERLDHEAAFTIEACQGVDEILGIHLCKNLFLCNSQKTVFYLLLMPGEKKFRTKELSAQIGSARLSFAPEEFMKEYMNLTPGSVTVMGLMNDQEHRINLLIDKDIMAEEFVGCHPCVNTASIKIKTKDLLEKFLPCTGHAYRVVELKGED